MLNEKSNKNVKVEEFLKSLNLKEEVKDMKKKLDNSNVDFSSVQKKVVGSDSYLG